MTLLNVRYLVVTNAARALSLMQTPGRPRVTMPCKCCRFDPQPLFETDGVQVYRCKRRPRRCPLYLILAIRTPYRIAAITGMWMKLIWPAPTACG